MAHEEKLVNSAPGVEFIWRPRNAMSIYLDNAATSFPKPEQVCHAVDQTLRHGAANPGRGGYRLSLAAARVVFAAREAAAGLVGMPDPARIVFTANATEALNLALFGVLRPGDRVVTTSMEHNAVLRPLAGSGGAGRRRRQGARRRRPVSSPRGSCSGPAPAVRACW